MPCNRVAEMLNHLVSVSQPQPKTARDCSLSDLTYYQHDYISSFSLLACPVTFNPSRSRSVYQLLHRLFHQSPFPCKFCDPSMETRELRVCVSKLDNSSMHGLTSPHLTTTSPHFPSSFCSHFARIALKNRHFLTKSKEKGGKRVRERACNPQCKKKVTIPTGPTTAGTCPTCAPNRE